MLNYRRACLLPTVKHVSIMFPASCRELQCEIKICRSSQVSIVTISRHFNKHNQNNMKFPWISVGTAFTRNHNRPIITIAGNFHHIYPLQYMGFSYPQRVCHELGDDCLPKIGMRLSGSILNEWMAISWPILDCLQEVVFGLNAD